MRFQYVAPTFVRFASGLALLLAGATLSCATVILQVSNPAHNGVYVSADSTQSFGPATDNPAHATGGDVRASVRQFGSEMLFSIDREGSSTLKAFIASTGTGPDTPYFGAIPIQIIGNAGEAVGTPVNLTITPRAALNGHPLTTNFVNANAYSLSDPSVISSLKVGDTFDYWLSIAGNNMVSGDLTVALDVDAALVPTPVPEPATRALLFGILVAGVALRRRFTGHKIV